VRAHSRRTVHRCEALGNAPLLVHDSASYVTGETLIVDGGWDVGRLHAAAPHERLPSPRLHRPVAVITGGARGSASSLPSPCARRATILADRDARRASVPPRPSGKATAAFTTLDVATGQAAARAFCARHGGRLDL
jgi:NAD(P)-dependent dehydrogenase (short-subunit alcohol dehydrogenase family)